MMSTWRRELLEQGEVQFCNEEIKFCKGMWDLTEEREKKHITLMIGNKGKKMRII